MTQYLYDTEGRRVAKGSITTWSCDAASNGYTETSGYVLGPGGEQVTEMDGNGNWVHTNVYAGGSLIATYANDGQGVHFHLTDWLGTRRVQTDFAGNVQATYQSLPYGEMVPNNQTANMGATEQHFTGKERDAESGLDNFGARMYASTMGRWMSPDPSNLGVDIYMPQTWNKYNYAVNNPLTIKDANGLWPFYIHNEIIGESFPGMSKQDLQGLRDASWNMDFGKGQQNPSMSYEHGMSDGTTNQDPMAAQQMGDNFISQQVQTAQQAQADWEAQGSRRMSLSCEFGACGSSLIGGIGASYPAIPPQAQDFMNLLNWAFTGPHKAPGFPWHHGNWCGKGGAGIPIDGLDWGCLRHDYCYASHGLSLGNNYGFPSLDELGQGQLQNCNEQLCRSADRTQGIPDAAWVTRYFTYGVGNAAGCAHY